MFDEVSTSTAQGSVIVKGLSRAKVSPWRAASTSRDIKEARVVINEEHNDSASLSGGVAPDSAGQAAEALVPASPKMLPRACSPGRAAGPMWCTAARDHARLERARRAR